MYKLSECEWFAAIAVETSINVVNGAYRTDEFSWTIRNKIKLPLQNILKIVANIFEYERQPKSFGHETHQSFFLVLTCLLWEIAFGYTANNWTFYFANNCLTFWHIIVVC